MLLSSLFRPVLHHKRPSTLIHIANHFRCPKHFQAGRHIVTTETAPKQDINIRPFPRKTSDPLRILFCGSDQFSCASLSALHALHKEQPDLVESIDVLVRPGKPAGRGLKRIAVGPLFHLAHELNLPLHQRDTFTGWDLPLPGRVTDHKTGKTTIIPHPDPTVRHRPHHPFNLLIAVSFGLFVPPRILNTLKYGGLNIHPSLLPDLRGPAPIQWALLLNRTHTGCTLQTLHPKTFDNGAILLQTPPPGVPIPQDSTTTHDLLTTLATEGASMLVQGLRNNHHVPPHIPSSITPVPPEGQIDLQHAATGYRDAPKITKADLAIDWGSMLWASRDHHLYPAGQWTASDLARRFRAVGAGAGAGAARVTGRGLWTHAFTTRQPNEQRLIFEDVEAVVCPAVLRDVVRMIVRVKQKQQQQLAVVDGSSDSGTNDILPRGRVGNVVFGMQPDLAMPQRQFRVPVLKEEAKTSVVVPIRVPYRIVNGVVEVLENEVAAIRVKRIKVEGRASEEASRALKPFWEKNVIVEDLSRLEYAMDVIAKQVD